MEAVKTKKIVTLCVIHDEERVLLGMKKRGFGEGKWNGFGGKIEPGETIEEAARREVLEESGIELQECRMRGVLEFEFEDGSPEMEVHVFSSSSFTGEPGETDEMRPEWYAHADIPYHDMWADDIHWMPLLLAGKNFKGRFRFQGTENLIQYSLKCV